MKMPLAAAVTTPALLAVALAACAGLAAAQPLPGGTPAVTVPAEGLRDAIARAPAGAAIRVTAGTLRGPLVVDRPLRLLGTGRPVVDGGERGTVVRLAAPDTVFSGFSVRRSGASLLDDDAAILVTADRVTVADVDVDEALHGIYLLRANGFRLLRNRIRGKTWINDENRGNGIHLHAANDGAIEGNDIGWVRDGVYFNYASRNVITANHAHHLRYGLHYMWSHDNRFVGNRFTESVGGAALMYSHGIVFEQNTFARHRGFRAHGVLLKDVERCRATGNRFLDNSEGITLDGAIDNRFEENLVAGNDAAIVEYGNSEGNLFARNAFLGNGTDLREVGQSSSSRWDDGARGNYWSTYDGFDLDGDGVGDTPHRLQNLFEYLEGERPMLGVLAHGPGAFAVRLAERAFPLLRQRETADRRPLMRVPPEAARGDTVDGDPTTRWRLAATAMSAFAAGLGFVFACSRGRRS